MSALGRLFALTLAFTVATETAWLASAEGIVSNEAGLVAVIGLSLALLFALGTPWRSSITVSGQP